MSKENFQVQKCVNVLFTILMLSETGLQAHKMDTSNKLTFFCVQLHRLDSKCHKKAYVRILKRKIHFLYTECPANVCDKTNNLLHSQTHNLDPPFLYNSSFKIRSL